MALAIPVKENELYNFFKSIKKVVVLEIETLTAPKVIKGCPYDVSKVTKRRVKVGRELSIKDEIETNQAAEGLMPNYTLSPRQWGVHVKGTPFVRHNDEVYLPCIVESNVSVEYIDNVTGNSIPFVDIVPYLVKAKEPKKQAGIVKKAIYRNYNINSIMSVKLLEKETKLIVS